MVGGIKAMPCGPSMDWGCYVCDVWQAIATLAYPYGGILFTLTIILFYFNIFWSNYKKLQISGMLRYLNT